MNAAVCCVTENRRSWFPKVLNLVSSVRTFGGRLAQAHVIVCVVDDCDPSFRQSLTRLDVDVRIVPAVDPVIRYANKLRMFQLDDLECDVLLALDCDTIVVNDPCTFLDRPAVRLKPVDRNFLTDDQWRRLYQAVGLSMPSQTYRTTADAEPIHPYFNSGVLVIPADHAAQLADLWHRYVFDLKRAYERERDLALWQRFNDQFALSCAIMNAGYRIEELPVSMNFPTHVRIHPSLMRDLHELFVIHYHVDLDERGFVLGTGYELANQHIDRFNRTRAAEWNIPYEGLARPPLSIRARRRLQDVPWLRGQQAERVKQRANRLLSLKSH
jgi:hypothetical protein